MTLRTWQKLIWHSWCSIRVRQSLREREDWLSVIRQTGRSTALSLWLFQEQISNLFLKYKLYKRWSSSLLWREFYQERVTRYRLSLYWKTWWRVTPQDWHCCTANKKYLPGKCHFRSSQIWRRSENNNDTWNSSYLPSEFGDELPSNICKRIKWYNYQSTSIYTIPQMITSINSSISESLTFYLQKHTKEERHRLKITIVRTILLETFVQWYQIQNIRATHDWQNLSWSEFRICQKAHCEV